jgi:hypothetical protein
MSASHASVCHGVQRHVRPKHRQTIACMEIGANLGQLQTAPIKLMQQLAFTLEAGMANRQAAADAPRASVSLYCAGSMSANLS